MESVPLMVKNGDGTLDFKFYSYTNDLTSVAGKACTGSAAFTFIDLVGSYLFLHDTGNSKYVVCQYDHTLTAMAPVILTTSGLVTGTISQFDPYLNDGTTLFVLVGDGTVSQVVSFDAASGLGTKVGNFYCYFNACLVIPNLKNNYIFLALLTCNFLIIVIKFIFVFYNFFNLFLIK